jgi:hypothetical protein
MLVGVDDLVDEWAGQAVAASGHVLGADSQTNLDCASLDLCGDVLDSLEAGGAEAVDAAGGGGCGEASSEAGCANVVCGLRVGDLFVKCKYTYP